MTGWVDSTGHALVKIRLRHPETAAESEIDAWIDTGFTGELILSSLILTGLNLPFGPEVRATLADGSQIVLQTHTCLLHWFGEWKTIEIVANQGKFPLLGVGLLLDRDLSVNYRAKIVTIA